MSPTLLLLLLSQARRSAEPPARTTVGLGVDDAR
jgi:hypothetical protein